MLFTQVELSDEEKTLYVFWVEYPFVIPKLAVGVEMVLKEVPDKTLTVCRVFTSLRYENLPTKHQIGTILSVKGYEL